MGRMLSKFAGTIYGWLRWRRRLTYREACEQIDTPFKALSYLLRWFKYRANEDSKYNCLMPKEVWDEKMIDGGKHWDDCDGYAAAMIDPLRVHGWDCAYLCVFTRESGHATLLIVTPEQVQTLGTFGLKCHGRAPELFDVAQWFYEIENVKYLYISDRKWNVKKYGEWVNGEFIVVDVE